MFSFYARDAQAAVYEHVIVTAGKRKRMQMRGGFRIESQNRSLKKKKKRVDGSGDVQTVQPGQN